MQVFHKLDDVPANFGPAIVSIGNFDGVHRGHVQVIEQIVARAGSQSLRAMVVTFDPHPSRFLRPNSDLKLITPLAAKLQLLSALGLDAALVLPFNADLAGMSPEDFATNILKHSLRAREVYEGYNFRFGHKAAGDVDLLASLGRKLGFEVVIYPEMRLRGEPVSSSHIRKLLISGCIANARHLLGRPFSIVSTASSGRGYGTQYTVPTINLSDYAELVPKLGVYITRTRIGSECFDSVSNVGNRPTFGSDSFAIESHLLNFHPIELNPDTEIELHFLKRLRDEVKFPSVDALRAQIGRDVARAQRYFRLSKRKP